MADFPLRKIIMTELKQHKLQQQHAPYTYKKFFLEAAWFANIRIKHLEDAENMR